MLFALALYHVQVEQLHLRISQLQYLGHRYAGGTKIRVFGKTLWTNVRFFWRTLWTKIRVFGELCGLKPGFLENLVDPRTASQTLPSQAAPPLLPSDAVCNLHLACLAMLDVCAAH